MDHHHTVAPATGAHQAPGRPPVSEEPSRCGALVAPLPWNERERLEALRGYAVLDTSAEPAFDDITRQAARVCGTSIALVSLVDEERQWFKSRHGLDVLETRREVAFCAHTILQWEMLLVRDTLEDARFRTNPLVTGPPGIRFYAGVPLVTPEGFSLGTLCVIDLRPHQLTPEQGQMLEFLARQVVHLLEARRCRRTRERLERDVRLGEERLEALRSALHESVWEWDPGTRRVTGSPGLGQLLGEPCEDLEISGWFERIHPEDRTRVLGAFRKALESDATLWTQEVRLRRKRGAWARVSCRAVLVRDEVGALVRVVGTTLDLSEREELHARLALSDRMASVGTLAAGVAHELNNPLAYVIANLDFVRGELEAGGEPSGEEVLTQVLTEAREGAERMRHIVRDMKLFSRPDDARLEWVELPRAIDSAVAMAWNEIRHRARLVKDYQPVPAVFANEARLGQVFLNLLVNAAHAIPEGAAGSNEIRVCTRVDTTGHVLIEVHDTGSGIPEELRGRILEPFFTTKPLGVGTGLGLSISQDIVTSLGGMLEFESEVGRGTVFRVVLAPAERARDEETSPRERPEQARRRGHVVVVDDEPRMLGAIQRALGPAHDVTVFSRASAALAWMERGAAWDLLLCDVMMPEMTGMALHAELTRRAPEKAGHVVFLTGGAFTERAREFLGQVPNARMEKPLNFQLLRELLDARLRSD